MSKSNPTQSQLKNNNNIRRRTGCESVSGFACDKCLAKGVSSSSSCTPKEEGKGLECWLLHEVFHSKVLL